LIKVLVICGDIKRVGGIEKYNNDFISSIQKTNINLKVIFRKKGGFIEKFLFVVKVIYAYIFYRPKFLFCGHINFSFLCFIANIFNIDFSISTYGIDMIKVDGFFKRFAMNNSKIIITLSIYVKTLILNNFPDLSNKIFMLESSVDGNLLKIKKKNKFLMKKYNLNDEDPIIMSLARLSSSEDKGQNRVLKALPYVLKKYPNLKYLIVGSGEDDRVDKILHDNPRLALNVIKTGEFRNNEKVDLLNIADLYILPSKLDGFLITFIEALACGIPVIASDKYGCPNGLLNGKLGFLVDPDNIESISKSILLFLDGKAPQEYYKKNFLRNKTLNIYGLPIWQKKVENLINLIDLGKNK
jgi:phosphatidyl-myo-inositol dimannoside synthase